MLFELIRTLHDGNVLFLYDVRLEGFIEDFVDCARSSQQNYTRRVTIQTVKQN